MCFSSDSLVYYLQTILTFQKYIQRNTAVASAAALSHQ